jgi:3-oxoacyl-[acyl-carrier-protein] synthase II
MYITASSTISHQPTFQNKGFSSVLSALQQPSEIINPDYSKFITIMERRRMSDVLKMSITCAFDCLEQAEIKDPGAIIVGTGMGCATHTKNFMDKINTANGGLISPTAFISSTHNTIAGQISVLLGNHNYNMTHTQNSLSFEQALLDGILCISEGNNNILIGAADETEPALYNFQARLKSGNISPASGASFFVLASEKKDERSVKLVDVASFGLMNHISGLIHGFLKSNDLSPDDIDLLLYSGSERKNKEEIVGIFNEDKAVDYQEYSGTYFTSSGFAMSFALDVFSQEKHPLFGEGIERILVCNNLIPEHLGLILIQKNT